MTEMTSRAIRGTFLSGIRLSNPSSSAWDPRHLSNRRPAIPTSRPAASRRSWPFAGLPIGRRRAPAPSRSSANSPSSAAADSLPVVLRLPDLRRGRERRRLSHRRIDTPWIGIAMWCATGVLAVVAAVLMFTGKPESSPTGRRGAAVASPVRPRHGRQRTIRRPSAMPVAAAVSGRRDCRRRRCGAAASPASGGAIGQRLQPGPFHGVIAGTRQATAGRGAFPNEPLPTGGLPPVPTRAPGDTSVRSRRHRFRRDACAAQRPRRTGLRRSMAPAAGRAAGGQIPTDRPGLSDPWSPEARRQTRASSRPDCAPPCGRTPPGGCPIGRRDSQS